LLANLTTATWRTPSIWYGPC